MSLTLQWCLRGDQPPGAVPFVTVMKVVAMSSISDVADITYHWSEITIWCLQANFAWIRGLSGNSLQRIIERRISYRHRKIIHCTTIILARLRKEIYHHATLRYSAGYSATYSEGPKIWLSGIDGVHAIGSGTHAKGIPQLYSINKQCQSEQAMRTT